MSRYDAIGVGPGLGTSVETKNALKLLLQKVIKPIVIDADALNIISEDKSLLSMLQPKSILTPHPKEFDRLFGDSKSGYDRLIKQLKMAEKYNLIIVLKGAYTSIAFPDGRCFFNTTGNPGMATAGSGDVLTGVILSLLAQKYSQEDAALLGVYLHGLAGDLAVEKISKESLIASDIIMSISDAFIELKRRCLSS